MISRRTGLLAALIAVAAASLAAASSASAFIYWADSQNNRIGRSANDGSGVDDSFIQAGQLPLAVVVDSAHVYWANQNSGTIGRADLDGSGVDNSFISGLTQPSGVAVNESSVFWSTLAGQIGKAKIDGSAVNKELVSGISEPCGVALDSGHVYWADIATGTPAYIGRAGLDGFSQQREYVTIPGTSFPCGVAVNSANIFWSEPGLFGGGTRIGRANTSTGTGADPSFIGDAHTPCGIAVHGSQLYWANAEANTIARANTDGTSVNQSFVQTGGSQICGVAVDDLAPPPPGAPTPTPSPPQTKIAAGPGKGLGSGVAKFRFSSSEAGSRFECRLDKGKARRCKSPKRYRRLRPGKHTFKVWAIGAGGKDPSPAKRAFRVPST